MKNFFTILDKNFTNLIIMFIAALIGTWFIVKYSVSWIDIFIYDLSFIVYLRFIDKIFVSFKKGDKNV